MDLDVILEVIDDMTVGEDFGNARRIVLLGDVAPVGKVVSSTMIVILDMANLKDCVKCRIGRTYESVIMLSCLKDGSIYGVKCCLVDDFQFRYDTKQVGRADFQSLATDRLCFHGD